MTNRKIIVDREEIPASEIKPNMDFDKIAGRISATPKSSSITRNLVVGIGNGCIIIGVIFIAIYFLNAPVSKTNSDAENQLTTVRNPSKNDPSETEKNKVWANQSDSNNIQKKPALNLAYTKSNSSTRSPYNQESYNSLDDFYKRNALPLQFFTIAADRDTTITGEQGTKLVIKANSFVDSSGQPALRQITITLKECYKLEDMLNENLTTMSNHNILASGGMIYIGANAEGKQLQLKKFEEMEMYNPIPEVMADTNMFVFYGKPKRSGGINWEIDNYSRVPYPVATLTGGKFHDTATIKYFAKHYRFAKKNMVKALNQKEIIDFKVSFNELIKPTGSSGGLKELLPGMPLCEFLKLVENNYIPQIQTATRETPFEFTIFDKDKYETYYIEYAEYLKDEDINKGVFKYSYDSTMVFNSYKSKPFYIEKIGWLNCDKYLAQGPTKNLNTIYIALSSIKEEDVKLVFYSGNRPSVVKSVKVSNTWQFPNIPVGKEVTVTGTLLKNGEVFTSSKVFKVQKEEKLRQMEYLPKAMP